MKIKLRCNTLKGVALFKEKMIIIAGILKRKWKLTAKNTNSFSLLSWVADQKLQHHAQNGLCESHRKMVCFERVRNGK